MADTITRIMEELRGPLEARMRTEMSEAANRTASNIIAKFFWKSVVATPSGATVVQNGPGYEELEKKLDEIYGSVNFQKKMEKYFEENFDRIFSEIMEKSIKHGIRKKLFNDGRTMASVKAKEHNVKSKD